MNFWDDSVYQLKKQWNMWPYLEVLSELGELKKSKNLKHAKLLEIGCGVGNNLIPIAQMGFACSGIDISEHAIKEASSRASKAKTPIDLKVGDISHMNFLSNSFQIVIDRSVITCTNEETTLLAIAEIYRVLEIGGYFFAFDWFGENHSDLKYGDKISENSYQNFKSGNFKNVSIISTFSERRIKNLFTNFEIMKITKHLKFTEDNKKIHEHFNFIAKKLPQKTV
jgi:ubiquinone/menaquinone biosynthesis C-methylase UbiE